MFTTAICCNTVFCDDNIAVRNEAELIHIQHFGLVVINGSCLHVFKSADYCEQTETQARIKGRLVGALAALILMGSTLVVEFVDQITGMNISVYHLILKGDI